MYLDQPLERDGVERLPEARTWMLQKYPEHESTETTTSYLWLFLSGDIFAASAAPIDHSISTIRMG
jgi:hypothetical protein